MDRKLQMEVWTERMAWEEKTQEEEELSMQESKRLFFGLRAQKEAEENELHQRDLHHQELMRVRAEEVRAEQALRETAALEMEIERKDELIATRGALVPHEKSKAIWA